MPKALPVALLLILTFFSLTKAQILITRNHFAVPLDDTTGKRAFFGRTVFSAEGARGFLSAQGEQAWNIKYVGFVELYRFNPRTAIGLTLAHELTANPHNSIGFHMRGAIWNETLALYRRLGRITVEAGFTHHCRHEIDNSIPADEANPWPDYKPTRRLIIMTSPFVAFSSPNVAVGQKVDFRWYVRGNYYTYQVDGRTPSDNQTQSWDYLKAAALAGFTMHWRIHPNLALYNRSWLNLCAFSQGQPVKSNHRVELGLKVTGEKAAHFEFFGAYERFFDDVSRAYPMQSNVLYVGIRGRSRLFF